MYVEPLIAIPADAPLPAVPAVELLGVELFGVDVLGAPALAAGLEVAPAAPPLEDAAPLEAAEPMRALVSVN